MADVLRGSSTPPWTLTSRAPSRLLREAPRPPLRQPRDHRAPETPENGSIHSFHPTSSLGTFTRLEPPGPG